MRFYPDDHITGYWIYAGYNDKTQKSYYLRCIRIFPNNELRTKFIISLYTNLLSYKMKTIKQKY